MSKLFNEFSPVSLTEWKEKIQIDLKGADYKEKLISQIEGIEIDAVYHQENSPQNNPINSTRDWDIYQLIDGSNPSMANQAILQALSNGVSALCIDNPNDLDTLFKDVLIQHIRVDFRNYSSSTLQDFETLIQKRGIDTQSIKGAFHGKENGMLPNFFYQSILIEGKTAQEQIADALIQGKKSQEKKQFVFSVGNNYFLEIAKLRAFRILWNQKTGENPYILAQNELKSG